jgi:hypothetical protein
MLNAPLRKYRLHFAFFIFTVTANLSITISIERAYAQVADESVVSPALRISPIPERRVLEEADLFAVDECLSASFRCIDGTGNNVDDPFLGAAGTQLLRHVDAAYGNGFNSLRSGPNPRLISNAVNAQLVSIHNELSASDFVWAWGQFLDHDIDLTIEADDPLEPEPIPVPPPDPFFDPDGTGTQEIAFNRERIQQTHASKLTSSPRSSMGRTYTAPTIRVLTPSATRPLGLGACEPMMAAITAICCPSITATQMMKLATSCPMPTVQLLTPMTCS